MEVSKDAISKIETLLPKNEVIEKFNIFIGSVSTKRKNNEMENQQLTSLRDWLLPMLMNGQISIK